VLLVEDEEAVRRIISAVLRRQGYTVIETSSPMSAIELFKRHVEAIDLLVTDVIMPVMNGPALAQRLVAIRPALRVLFISGYTGLNSPEIQNPNVGFLSKPFQTSVLAARVREMLSRPNDKRVI
jgi:DNA-binding NtrC family response regulator